MLPLNPSSPWGPGNLGPISSPGAIAEEFPEPPHQGPWVRVDGMYCASRSHELD